jgi:hypothetical protein
MVSVITTTTTTTTTTSAAPTTPVTTTDFSSGFSSGFGSGFGSDGSFGGFDHGGFSFDDHSTTMVVIANCQSYDPVSNLCLACVDGYYLSPNQ